MSTTTVRAVNRELQRRGISARLQRNDGRKVHAFVFHGDMRALVLPELRIARTSSLSLSSWMQVLNALASEAAGQGKATAALAALVAVRTAGASHCMTPSRLRRWRMAQGLSLTRAAEELGVSRRTYCEWESGLTRNTKQPVRLTRLLGLACRAIEAGLEPIGGQE